MKFQLIRLKNLVIIAMVLFSSFAFSENQQGNLKKIINSEKRFLANLSGAWERSLDMQTWTPVNIPCSEKYDGKIIYKRAVKIPQGMTDNYTWQIYFLGIDHQIEIYWNEQFIGRYVGALTPFTVRIPEKAVRNDINEIRFVLLPAEGRIKQIRNQTLNSKQSFTGLIRDLILVGTPQSWISDIKTIYKIKNDIIDLKVDVSITSSEIKNLVKRLNLTDSLNIKTKDKILLSLQADLKKKNGEIVATTNSKQLTIESDRTAIESLSLGITNAILWTPDNPELYDLQIKIKRNDLVIDDLTTSIGFRSIVASTSGENSKLLINGETLKIKGVSYIEDFLGSGQTLTEYQIKQDIELIKKLGANVIRAKYNPPDPLFVKYCDIYGLLLMVELPLYEVPAAVTNLDEVKIHMQNLAKQYITNYSNSPSVFAWGIGAGVDEDDKHYNSYCESLLKLFSKESDKLKYKIVPHNCENVYSEGFDFIGYHDLRKNIDLSIINSEFVRLKSLIGNKPLFMAYGSEIQINNHNGYSDPLSLEYQAYNILNSYKIVEKNNGVGSVLNSFNDYLQNKPSMTTDNPDKYVNTSGLVDRKRNERLSFATMQALFNNEKEPLLNAGSFAFGVPVIYLVLGIILAIVLVLLTNRFRRFREYMFRSLLRPYNFYADIRDQRIISSMQTILLGVIISFTVGIYLSSILHFFKNSEVLEYLLMIIVPSNSLKETLFELIWMPELSLFIIALISLILAFLTGWLIRMIAILTQVRVFWSDCITISIWAALPTVLLLPISFVLMRLLIMSPGSSWFFLFLYFVTAIWTILRLLKSISVVFDTRTSRVYTIGGIIFALFLLIPLGYLHIKYSFFDFWTYYSNIFLN